MNDRDSDPVLDTPTVAVLAVFIVVFGGIAGLFIVDIGSGTPEPAKFGDTVSVGLTLEDKARLEQGDPDIELPRMQVFYSQTPYVVGYYGVESFVAKQRDPAHEQRFGFPRVAYVVEYADTDLSLNQDGIPESNRPPDWIEAEEAFYVVDSEARMPSGEPTAIPFDTRTAAASFVDQYGGTILTWEAMLDTPVDIDDAEAVRETTADQHTEADERIAATDRLSDRPAETVVGRDEPTLQGAIDAAEPNTTVVVPAGTYDGPISIDQSLTLEGQGDARIVGDNNGTVVRVNAPDTAILGVNISGVGDEIPGKKVADDHSPDKYDPGGHDRRNTDSDEAWDATIDEDYAGGDAAIAVTTAPGVLVADTEIYTDAAGVILRDSSNFVVQNTTVVGTEAYRDGHMGVAAMRSVGVVENSTFVGGLDGIYTHRADGIVLRGNEIVDNRMGIHLMFTSNALLANNTISGQEETGLYVMTGPEGNAIVGNEISDTFTGLSVGGSDTYVADNVLRDNLIGLRINTAASIFEGNIIIDNRDGIETWSLLPTNRVTRNDFVGNENHVGISTGRLQVWTHDGVGNYWDGAFGKTDGTVIQRSYVPTDSVDSRLHRVEGTETLAQAPALGVLAGFEGAVPGMRSNEIVDTAPLCSPVNEAYLERMNRSDVEPICRSERDPSTVTAR